MSKISKFKVLHDVIHPSDQVPGTPLLGHPSSLGQGTQLLQRPWPTERTFLLPLSLGLNILKATGYNVLAHQ